MHQYNSTMGVCMSHFWQEQEPWLPTNKHQTRTNKVPWFVHVVHAPAKDGDLAGGTEFECTKHQQHSFCDFLPNEVAFHSLFSWYMINTCCPAPNWWANWCDLYVFVVCSFCSFVPVCEGWKYTVSSQSPIFAIEHSIRPSVVSRLICHLVAFQPAKARHSGGFQNQQRCKQVFMNKIHRVHKITPSTNHVHVIHPPHVHLWTLM